MKGSIKNYGKKLLSIVLALVMTVGLVNSPAFVESVSAATAESTFYFYSTTSVERIWCWSDGVDGNNCWPENLGGNWYKFTLSCANGAADGRIYFEVVGGTSTLYEAGYTQGTYYGYTGDTTAYSSWNAFTAAHPGISNPAGGTTTPGDKPTDMNVLGKQGNGYQMDTNKQLDEMTDVNGQNTLFSVSAVMYNYFPGGGDSWWNQFKDLDNDIVTYYGGVGKITHPLITGAVGGREHAENNGNFDIKEGALSELIPGITMDDRLWYTNHNIAGNGHGGEGSWDQSKVNSPLQGLVAEHLSTEGELLSSENDVKMPYFDDYFLTGRAEKFGSIENPISFPFRDAGNGYYAFNSASGQDNVYMTSDKKLVYNSSSSAQIKDLTEDTVGFFPFNTTGDTTDYSKHLASGERVKAGDMDVNYGFGMRLDIPFNMPKKTGSDVVNVPKVTLTNSSTTATNSVTLPNAIKNGQYLLLYNVNGENINLDSVKIGNNNYSVADNVKNLVNLKDNGNVAGFDRGAGSYIVYKYEGADTTSVDINCRAYGDGYSLYPLVLDSIDDAAISTAVKSISSDIVFNFSGDDDIWVYVDGRLALDMGGNHGMSKGQINFTTGMVTVQNPQMVSGNGITTGKASESKEWLKFDDNEVHTLTVFYMERGLYDSNLSIEFNFSPVQMTQQNGLTVTNKMDIDAINDGLKAKVKEIMEKDGFHYDVEDKTKGKTLFDDGKITFPGDGEQTQSETIEGEEELGNSLRNSYVSVSQTPDSRFDTTYSVSDKINNTTIKESTSGTDADDGRNEDNNKPDGTSVWVQNSPKEEDAEKPVSVSVDYVNVAKASGFTVEKRYEGSDLDTNTEFTFEVKYTKLFGADNAAYNLDGSLAGITYIVNGVTKTVDASSQIKLKAGEKAEFTGIPVDTVVTVKEIGAGKTFKNVSVSASSVSDQNATLTVNDATPATIGLDGNTPAYVYTNGDADRRQLVYYSEINKVTDLPLPDDLTAQKTVIPDVVEPEIINHEKSGTITMNGADNADITVSTTISNVQANINGSNQHILKITSPAQGGYGIKSIRINNTTYDYNAIRNNYLQGTCDALYEGWLIDIVGTITIPFTLNSDGDVTVAINYRGWSVSYAWPVVIDEGVTETQTGSTEPTEPQYINIYDSVAEPTMIHNATDANVATINFANGNAETGVKNQLTFISKHVGYDKFTLNLHNNESNMDEKVDVIVYNYNVNNRVYVLDYGLPVDLLADNNGLLGGSKPYDYNNNLSITNKDTLQNNEDIDGYTTLGFAKNAVGEIFKSSVSYGYKADDFAKSMQFNQASLAWSADNKEVVYTPEKFMSEIDTFYFGVQVTKDGYGSGDDTLDATNATPVMVGKVDVMPATVVYYEDNFSQSGTDADGKNGIIYAGNAVTVEGTTVDKYQSNDLDVQYGYDDVYADQSYGYGNGSAHALGYASQAAFEFKGTGFDIISRTNQATGTMIVNVYKKVKDGSTAELSVANNKIRVSNGTTNLTTNLVKAITINSYYENGDLYQIPLISWNSGEDTADEYIVVITSFDTTKSKAVYIDGIRIYNPLNTPDANKQYDANKELGAEVKGIKNLIFGEDFEFNYSDPLESNIDEASPVASLVKFNADGAYFLSGKTVVESFNGIDSEQKETDPNTTKDLMTYAVNGPNNELYLENGYGLGFYVDKEPGNATLQIAVKNVSGKNGLKLQYLSTNGWKDIATVKSATEVYYRLDTLDDLYVDEDGMTMAVLRVSGGSGFLSLTNLKVKGYDLSPLVLEETPEGVLDTSLNASDFTYKSAYNTKTKSFNKNQNAIVKFTTSDKVEDILLQLDGEDVQLITASSKAKSAGKIEWTVKFKTTGSVVLASKYTVTAYDENGNYSEAVSFK